MVAEESRLIISVEIFYCDKDLKRLFCYSLTQGTLFAFREGEVSEYCGLPGLIFLIRDQKALRDVHFPGVGSWFIGLYSRVDDTPDSR